MTDYTDIFNITKNKVYVITTVWEYPFGGGEEFMYTTIGWASSLGMYTYWISFSKPNGEQYKEMKIGKLGSGTYIKVPGGFDEKNLSLWLKLLRPDVVHHQGHLREQFYNVCNQLRLEFVSGFHFWTGGVILNPETNNVAILNNKHKHKPDPDFMKLVDQPNCHLYAASEFVREVFEEVTKKQLDIIYATSCVESCLMPNFSSWKQDYITVINIHKFKGGELVAELIERMVEYPFYVVRTEYMSEELDKRIEEAINKNNEMRKGSGKTQSIFSQRVSDPKIIYAKTKIFLATSIVDETFCRTVNEALMNGIPVITTGAGNIRYLVGEKGIKLDIKDTQKWIENIERLYNNEKEHKEYSDYMRKQYLEYSEDKSKKLFANMMFKALKNSKEYNVMIFSPWCDQGLGIQSRNYHRILESHNYRSFIFAVKPYNANSSLDLQKNKEEWVVENVYYTKNDREHTTDIELKEFVLKYNIGKCLLPETCWYRVFQIAKFLRSLNVKVYAIPNIEIVRRDEIFKHNYFFRVLCNNRLCENIFNNHGITNTNYVGYGMFGELKNISKAILNKNDTIEFLFIGGMNAFSRKHILEICESFCIAYEKVKNIRLTATIQMTNLLEIELKDRIESYRIHPAINIIDKHLTYKDILGLYERSRVSIQVSKHEGLGLGFYEALMMRVPIISLDTQPHNEIVKNDVNGWLIQCYYKKMIDNKDPIFDSAYFEEEKLANLIVELASNPDIINKIDETIGEDYDDRLSYNVFSRKFINAL